MNASRHYFKVVLDLEEAMGKKAKSKLMLLAPKRRGSIPRSEILKAIRKVAARRRGQQVAVCDGSK